MSHINIEQLFTHDLCTWHPSFMTSIYENFINALRARPNQ